MAPGARAVLEMLNARVAEAREKERAAKDRENELARLRLEAALAELDVPDEATIKEREAEEARRKLQAQDQCIAKLELEIFDLENRRSIDIDRYHALFDLGYRLPRSPAWEPLRRTAYSSLRSPASPSLRSSAYSTLWSPTYPSPRIPTQYSSASYRQSHSTLYGCGVPRSTHYSRAEGSYPPPQHSSFERAQQFDYPDSVPSLSSDQLPNHRREVPVNLDDSSYQPPPTRSTRYGPYRPSPNDHDSGLPPTRSTPYGPYRPEPYAGHDLYSGAARTPPRRRVRFD